MPIGARELGSSRLPLLPVASRTVLLVFGLFRRDRRRPDLEPPRSEQEPDRALATALSSPLAVFTILGRPLLPLRGNVRVRLSLRFGVQPAQLASLPLAQPHLGRLGLQYSHPLLVHGDLLGPL